MRELTSRRDLDNQQLIGFGCSGCEWLFRLYPDETIPETPPASVELVVNTFKGHDCRDYPIAKAA